MIIVIQTGIFQTLGLMIFQHTQRDTGFQPHVLHTFNHCYYTIHITVFQISPGSTHTKTAGPSGFSLSSGFKYFIQRH